ncbi:hypothetical protein EB821_05200, partial [Candidatus Marinimicrobia bacterium PRS2]
MIRNIYILLLLSLLTTGWGQDCVDGEEVELWDECYNIEETTSLNLSWYNLSGPIPPAIGQLTNLTLLKLTNNDLNGSIPEEIGDLTNLEYLHLDNNQLSGIIPDELCNLSIDWSNTDYFSMDDNYLCPLYPDCIEENMGEQDVSECDDWCNEGYTGINGGCYYQSDLDVLQAFIGNSQEGNNSPQSDLLPIELGVQIWEDGRLVALCSSGDINSDCYMDYTLSGVIPIGISNLENLNELNLSYNELSGDIPSAICNLSIDWSNPENFSVVYNNFCPPYPYCVEEYMGEQDTSLCVDCDEGYTGINGGCYYQSDLDVLQAFIDNSQEGSNPPSPFLSSLSLGDQDWEDGRLTVFCISRNSWHVRCRENFNLSGDFPDNISNWTEIRTLSVWEGAFSDSLPTEIFDLTNLTELRLVNQDLIGEIPHTVGNLSNLEDLDIRENLSGSIPPEIGNLTNLTFLRLGDNQLTGSIPPEIGQLMNLTYLGLYNNQLTGEIPPEICNQGDSSPTLYSNNLCPIYPDCGEGPITSEEEQNTSECPLCSEGYAEIESTCYYQTDLDILQVFIDSNESLSGQDPMEIGQQSWYEGRLISLNLSSLELTSIPDNIGNLSSLQNFNIQNNLLTYLPTDICELPSDCFIDVSDNQICEQFYYNCINYIGNQDASGCYFGCIDPYACNYDIDAVEDDGSCANEIDCAGECGGESVLSGCDNACNSTAVEDCAGECGGESVLSGCDNACNSTAVEDCAGECGGESVLSGCDNACNSTAVEDC